MAVALQVLGRRSPGQIADDDKSDAGILCPECLLDATCPKKGFPKITAGNRAAIKHYQLLKAFNAYIPQPFYNKLCDRMLIIAGEIEKIVNDKQEADAKRQGEKT